MQIGTVDAGEMGAHAQPIRTRTPVGGAGGGRGFCWSTRHVEVKVEGFGLQCSFEVLFLRNNLADFCLENQIVLVADYWSINLRDK